MRHSNSGNPPPTVHGLLLNYGNARHTALNYNTADTLPLSVAVLTHYALVHSANSGRVDHCWRARHCGGSPSSRHERAVWPKRRSSKHKVSHGAELAGQSRVAE